MTAKIRPASQEDKPAIMRILNATPEFKSAEVIVAEEVIDSYFDDPGGSGYHVMVAEISLNVVGYICYGPTPLTEGTWDIYWIAVDKERQGQGIGASLMAFAEDNIKKAEGRMVLIETSSLSGYEKTRRFYFMLGYDIVCQIPDFYMPGDHKIVFRKLLR
ncbi:MAG: GNAT family N-acetyltransferase [Chloroflexi bacterium]|nr:GNAT family N-acetyltransferase [Chloroflexota bacterium]